MRSFPCGAGGNVAILRPCVKPALGEPIVCAAKLTRWSPAFRRKFRREAGTPTADKCPASRHAPSRLPPPAFRPPRGPARRPGRGAGIGRAGLEYPAPRLEARAESPGSPAGRPASRYPWWRAYHSARKNTNGRRRNPVPAASKNSAATRYSEAILKSRTKYWTHNRRSMPWKGPPETGRGSPLRKGDSFLRRNGPEYIRRGPPPATDSTPAAGCFRRSSGAILPRSSRGTKDAWIAV